LIALTILGLIMLFPSLSFYPTPLRPKFLLQQPILRRHQPMFFLNVRDQVSHSHQTTGQGTVLNILTVISLDSLL
jgi:hypothetical protein